MFDNLINPGCTLHQRQIIVCKANHSGKYLSVCEYVSADFLLSTFSGSVHKPILMADTLRLPLTYYVAYEKSNFCLFNQDLGTTKRTPPGDLKWLAKDFKDCDIATGHSQLSHESRILKNQF